MFRCIICYLLCWETFVLSAFNASLDKVQTSIIDPAIARQTIQVSETQKDSLIHLLAHLPKNDSARFQILQYLAAYTKDHHHDDQHLHYFEAYLTLAKTLASPKHLAIAYREMTYYLSYHYETAYEQYYQEATQYFSQQKDTISLIYLKIDRIAYFNELYEFDQAKTETTIVSQLSQQINFHVALPIIDYALLFSQEEDCAKLIPLTNKILQAPNVHPYYLSSTALLKSQCLQEMEQLDSVSFYAEKAIEYFLQLKDYTSLQYAYSHLGDFHLQQGAIEKAKFYYAQIKPIENQLTCDCTPLVENYKNIGHYYSNKAIPDSAIIYYKKSIDQTAKENQLYQIDDILLSNEISITEKASTNPTLALGQLRQYITIKDSLSRIEKQNLLDVHKAENLAANKQRKIELLAAHNQLYQITLLAFGFIVMIILYFLWKVQQKNQLILEQKNALDYANNTKDRLFGLIAHDLRKPALAFRGISKKVNYLIQQKEFDTLNHFGLNLEKSAISLNNLLDNLLNWSLQQQNGLTYSPKTINVAQTIRIIYDLFQPIAQDKGVFIQLSINTNINAFVDENAFKTILRNLLDNAIKFTPNGGVITINTRQKNQQIIIKISDTGIGMSTDKVNKIFDLPSSKSTLGTDGEKGSGIGLNLVRELVKLNKGTIKVESQLKKGTIFEISFPTPL